MHKESLPAEILNPDQNLVLITIFISISDLPATLNQRLLQYFLDFLVFEQIKILILIIIIIISIVNVKRIMIKMIIK